MSRQAQFFLLVTLAFTLVITGCSKSSSTSAPQHNATSFSVSQSKANGDISSVQKLSESRTGMALYRVFYWSEGEKVEAYVVQPITPGKYPLLINCHGGFDVNSPSVSGYQDNIYTTDNILTNIPADAVYFYPNYRGYGRSEGYAHGMTGIVEDVENGIIATHSMARVKPNDLYLLGYSMGGGAALMIANQIDGVKAVAAISPFVGPDLFLNWYVRNGKPSYWVDDYLLFTNAYGQNPSGAKYKANSPYDNMSNIQAPVLVVQGTADNSVPYQMVQTYVHKLQQEHKVVKFDLIQGGNHALTNAVQRTDSEIDAWFEQYGMKHAY